MSHHEKLKRMIDERRIKEAKEEIFEDKFLFNGTEIIFNYEDEYKEEMYDSGQIKEAISLGAKWAINESLKELWHQTDEQPEGYDEWILLHYNVGNYYSLAQVKDFKSWKGFVERAPIGKWLYIDDLLPKEGGEQ